MEEPLIKLMQLGATLEGSEDLSLWARVIKCRIGGRLISSLIVTHEDMVNPEFNMEERVNKWVREVISDLEGEPNEQTDGPSI
jgi:hypothetical protein